MDSSDAVTALSALAQASRLAVFRHLVEVGHQGAHPSDIAHRLEVPANTLSFHLKALAHAGLIQAEQQGRFIRYRANFGAMQALVGFLTDNCCGGDPGKCAPAVPASARRTA